ncbi:MAG: tyrosine-type recombinase/integrase [Woeseiaceae bacterium]
MSPLRNALEEYLALRRSLGFGLRLTGRLLERFVEFADSRSAEFITCELALQWATAPADVQAAQWASRLAMVRRFARYHRATEPRTEVPPADLLPYRYHRQPPYIYSDTEVRSLLRASTELPSIRGLRAASYATLLGLYASTGLRTNEALRLDREDVDLAQGVLHVRQSKFGKSRCLPVHRSTQRALAQYAAQRDRLYPKPSTPGFFLSECGTRISEWSLRYTFVKLSHQIGLRAAGDARGPRIHDFRHRFAVNTLRNWYRAGVDVERYLPRLSTYLGHVHVTDTYWYLTATPELMQLARRQLEHALRGVRP